ncbi:MAG: gamma-glutamyl-phosphate reductase, partial [Polaromonas sp.]
MNAPDSPNALAARSEIPALMQTMGSQAKVASAQVARAQAAIKNRALLNLASLLRQNV